MKMVSYPPFVVFFDTIAIILFFLILNQNQRITIEPTEDTLFTGGEIIYKKNERYYRNTGEEYKPRPEEGDVYFFADCHERVRECKSATSKYDTKDVFILLPEHTYTDISKLTVLALKGNFCSNLKYYIAKNGQIDYKKIAEENVCLKKIPGFEELVKKRS